MKNLSRVCLTTVGIIFWGLIIAACSSAPLITQSVPPTSTISPSPVPTTPPTPTSQPTSSALFEYDPTIPFGLNEGAVTVRDGVSVHDINYASVAKGRLPAYLVVPPGKGPFAGVVFMHWLGAPNGNRDEFLDESVVLAKQGIVSLLVQGQFPWLQPPSGADADRVQVINQVVELRRALDLLISQPNVDPKRIGYVGHDYGAMFGGILSGVEKRIKAYCLMAGTPSFSDWSLTYWSFAKTDDEKAAYRKAMDSLDPIHYVPNAKPAAVFFQFAKNDRFIPESAATDFYSAASEPKQIKQYDATHSLDAAAQTDRMEWLLEQLKP